MPAEAGSCEVISAQGKCLLFCCQMQITVPLYEGNQEALEIRLTEIKFVCTSVYTAAGIKFLIIDHNQKSTTQQNGEAWERGRKSKTY